MRGRSMAERLTMPAGFGRIGRAERFGQDPEPGKGTQAGDVPPDRPVDQAGAVRLVRVTTTPGPGRGIRDKSLILKGAGPSWGVITCGRKNRNSRGVFMQNFLRLIFSRGAFFRVRQLGFRVRQLVLEFVNSP